ncbi:MAG: 50S ribosomal protein L25/general stress protein Ctc [Alphaproteobacteria bacterium]|jgi:large subunit ribosomal protein L25|nr:50S ribosomal protein L25/general stress protein Ctc [Pseudomonadota bacterium]NBP48631.1 50S ribosomal protein L25/general stress protein Ctc [Alphaproteobacteria bacterium]NCW30662.1 50S ribosomal protein L25/general stress protein Ctc [Alphaproteobacteria bacterium]NDA18923.1 50S ribosomal protein L25/general stress protein Ctc [Alphaproteobacteria bacterium]NDG36933.1 50S ribosomal protein L25/general stress protein Ctc [Alphaproteobacteria bacterium]
MSDNTTISAEQRERVGKGSARAVRRAGRVPAVIYGDKKEPLGITLETREITKIVHQPGIFGRLLDIKVGKDSHTVLTRDIQFHPVSDNILHMDFLRVSGSAKVAVAVAVEFINEDDCPGIKIGGVLNVVRYEVELLCPATTIPEKITVDLSGLKIGDSVHISTIDLPDGVTPTITDRDFTVATIASPGGGVKNEDEDDAEGDSGGDAAAENAEASDE